MTTPATTPGSRFFAVTPTLERIQEVKPALLRVAFVVTRSDSLGGASIHVRDFARHLISSGHSAQVFIGGEGVVTEALRSAGVPYLPMRHFARAINPWQDWRGFWELRRSLREYRPDLVSTHTSKAGVLGRLAAWSLRLPVIYTPHCWSFADGFRWGQLYLWIERLMRPFGRKIITVSEAERQDGLRNSVGGEDHLVTVRNGMPDVPSSYHAEPGRPIPLMMMVARFDQQKDHSTLFRALAKLQALPWQLECIGSGPLLVQAETEIAALGLKSRVLLSGYSREVFRELARAQIFVLSTHWESFPRSILEAMRAGLPVVATDVGGNAESVVDGLTGYTVPRSDPDRLAKCLEKLIADPLLREAFGCAGRKRYEQNYTFDNMLQNTAQVWESVLQYPVLMKTSAQVTTLPESDVVETLPRLSTAPRGDAFSEVVR